MENLATLLNLFLQEGPAETTRFMVLGYAVIFGTMGIYLASLFLRWRNFKKDQEVLEDLDQKK
ncbi:MAG: hypothetical protein HUU38_05875 [Anaerolineales bacterium]|nr:hypothetical protein [Anaerolineales bacterium]